MEDEEPTSETEPQAETPDSEVQAGSPDAEAEPVRFARGPLVREGVLTGDDRIIDIGALTTRDTFPLPLQYSDVTTVGHDGAQHVGGISSITAVDGDGYRDHVGEVEFDLANPAAMEASRKVASGFVRGVSVDLDALEIEERTEDGLPVEDVDDLMSRVVAGERIITAVTSGRIMGATITVFPAFQEAFIAPIPNEEMALVASVGEYEGEAWRMVIPFTDESDGWGTNEAALVAGVGDPIGAPFDVPVELDENWFNYPAETPDHVYGLRVEADGRIHGYLSGRDDHVSAGRKAPITSCSYAKALTGEHLCSNGRTIPVARIVAGTVHPHLQFDAATANHWYDNTGSVLGYFQPYEDRHGIYIAGGVKAGATVEQIAGLRGADVSGDWRPFSGCPDVELICALAVGVGGFNKGNPETLQELYMGSEDRQLALVASAGLHDNYRSVTSSVRPMAATGIGRLSRRDETLKTLVDVVQGVTQELATLRGIVDETEKARTAQAVKADAARLELAKRQAIARIDSTGLRTAKAAAVARIKNPQER